MNAVPRGSENLDCTAFNERVWAMRQLGHNNQCAPMLEFRLRVYWRSPDRQRLKVAVH